MAVGADADNDTLSYAITGGNTGGAFAIDSNTGEISVVNAALFDPVNAPTYTLTVTATDDGIPAASGSGTITVNVTETIIGAAAALKYFVPTDGSLDFTWRAAAFDDSGWSNGTFGIGFDGDPDYDQIIATDIEVEMRNISPSCYIRTHFNISDLGSIGDLLLQIGYDDGFIAYLNGTRVAISNMPTASGASTSALGSNDALATQTFDLTAFKNLLVVGDNVLAIHGANRDVNTDDFVINARLVSSNVVQGTVAPTILAEDDQLETRTSVALLGNITDNGNEDPSVTLYYGTTDGQDVEGNWDNSVALGTLGEGQFQYLLTGLTFGTEYFWALKATNSAGTAWSGFSAGATWAGNSFTTIGGVTETLVSEDATGTYRVPDATDIANEATWMTIAFDDSAWTAGQSGFGYDDNTTYDDNINPAGDVTAAMDGVNTSCWFRLPFTIAGDPSAYTKLTLRMKYDDGFVAYLNGVEIQAANAPAAPSPWNASATELHDDDVAETYIDYDVSAYLSELVAGTNVLAIHGLNDSLTSSDFLIRPELVAGTGSVAGETAPTVATGVPDQVGSSFAEVLGSVPNRGGADTQLFLVWGETDGGTDSLLWESYQSAGTIEADADFDTAQATLEGLKAGTQYFYRFFGVNAAGLSWAPTSNTFTTNAQTTASVTNSPATNVGPRSATLNGTFDRDGGLETAIVFAYGTADGGSDLGAWANSVNIGISQLGVVSTDIDGLEAPMTYFFRIFALNAEGTSSSLTSGQFNTVPELATVVMDDPASITDTSATLSGTVVFDGGNTTSITMVWGTSAGDFNPLNWDNATDLGVQTGAFSLPVAGLEPGTQYFFAAIATNTAGSGLSTVGSFYAGEVPLVTEGAQANYIVPASAANGEGTWFNLGFDDSTWLTGPTPIGYEDGTGYEGVIATDVNAIMNNVNPSIWIRIPFTVADASAVEGLLLRAKFDDGFVAYLNGTVVAQEADVPDPLLYDSEITAGQEADLNNWTVYNLTAFRGALVNGTNILAFHGLNDGVGSSDYLIIPELFSIPVSNDYAGWIGGYGLTGPDAARDFDFDKDGLTNDQEYAAGTDPTVNDLFEGGQPVKPSFTFIDDGATVAFTYRRRTDAAARGITYAVETSSLLADGTWTPVAVTETGTTPIAGTDSELVTVTFPAPPISVTELFVHAAATLP
ncbi:MAG: cadherin domain-containing protein [Verrucomicrobiales bacterium]